MKSILREAVYASQGMATRVKRWHTWPMIQQDTVGRHSCRAALIYLELFGTPRSEVLVYILQHDLGELTAGDTPFYTKQMCPGLADEVWRAEKMGMLTLGVHQPSLTDDEYLECKIADLMETWETALIDYSMGNKYAECAIKPLADEAVRIAKLLCIKFPDTLKTLLNFIHQVETTI